MLLSGAVVRTDHSLRLVPHGRLHDQYQREEFLCPGLLSFAAGVIGSKGGFRVKVRERVEEFEEEGTYYWIARTRWRDLNSPYLIVRDPMPWEDIPWLVRECEMAILAWVRSRNDPDIWKIPGLQKWIDHRDQRHIRKLGRRIFAKQYRFFWNRDLPRDLSIEPMQEFERERFGSQEAFDDWVGAD